MMYMSFFWPCVHMWAEDVHIYTVACKWGGGNREWGRCRLLFTQHMDIFSDKVLPGMRQVDHTLVMDFGCYIIWWAIIGQLSNDLITPLVRISLYKGKALSISCRNTIEKGTNLNNKFGKVIFSVCGGLVTDAEQCTSGIDRREVPTGGVDTNFRVRLGNEVRSERHWMSESKGYKGR